MWLCVFYVYIAALCHMEYTFKTNIKIIKKTDELIYKIS